MNEERTRALLAELHRMKPDSVVLESYLAWQPKCRAQFKTPTKTKAQRRGVLALIRRLISY